MAQPIHLKFSGITHLHIVYPYGKNQNKALKLSFGILLAAYLLHTIFNSA
jgi:hypothetical protein